MNNYSALIDTLIKAEMRGVPKHEEILFLGCTPTYITDNANFCKLQLAVKAATISKAAFDHGISTSVLKDLPSIIANPKGLYKSDSKNAGESVVVMTFRDHRDSPIIIPIKPSENVGRGQTHNVVKSIYGKEGPDPEVRWKKKGLLLWEPS